VYERVRNRRGCERREERDGMSVGEGMKVGMSRLDESV